MESFAESPLDPLTTPGDGWLEVMREAVEPRTQGHIGRYRILEEIRIGNQSVVFRALQPGTGREVALKRLAAGAFSSQAMRRRFEREVDAVVGLAAHPGIVTVHGVEEIDGVPLIAMEWIEGAPLTKWAEERELRSVLTAFVSVCEAVQHAHASGVIHRDLKPSNILVDETGRPRVLDFGLARRVDQDLDEEATRTVGFVGTPAYAAPEHFADGQAPVDVRSDVYSLGVVLYELTTGRRPFRAQRMRELIEQIEEHDPERPSRVSPRPSSDVGRELDTIIGKALAKDPARRYQSVHALGEDVDRYLSGLPVLAMPPSTRYQVAKWVRRHRPVVATSVVLVLVLAGSVAHSLRQASLIDAQREAAVEAQGEAELATERAEAALEDAVDARAELEVALEDARIERNRAQQVLAFLLNSIIDETSPYENAGSTDVRVVLARAAERVEVQFAAYPEVASDILAALARIHVPFGEYERAREIAERGLELWDAAEDPKLETRAVLLLAMGEVHMHGRRLEEGGAALEEAVAIFESLGERMHFNLGTTLGSLAMIRLAEKRYDEAEAAMRRSLELDTSPRDGRNWLFGRGQLARILLHSGRVDEAEEMLLETLEVGVPVLGEDDRVMIVTAGLLGQLYGSTGRWTEALPLLERDYLSNVETLGADHPEVGGRAVFYASALIEVERFEEGLELARIAVEQADEPLDAAIAESRVSAALMGLERYAESLGPLRRCVEGFWEHPPIAQEPTSTVLLAAMVRIHESADEAREILRRGFERFPDAFAAGALLEASTLSVLATLSRDLDMETEVAEGLGAVIDRLHGANPDDPRVQPLIDLFEELDAGTE